MVLVGGYFFIFKNKNKSDLGYKIYKVERKDIKSEVSVLGKVKSFKEVNLAFEQSGKVINIYKKVGDYVKEGEKLAELDNSEILLQIKQIESNIETNNIKLNYARENLKNNTNDLILKIKESYNKVNDAIRNKTNPLFLDDESESPRLNISISKEQLKIDLPWERRVFTVLLNNWEKDLELLNEKSNLDYYLTQAKENLEKTKNFLNKIILALNSTINNDNYSSLQNDIFLALNNINNTLVSLNNSERDYKNILKEIDLIYRNIEDSKINLELYKNKLEKMVLKSSINGLVVFRNVEIGEVVQPNKVVFTISGSGFEIEANISESDIAKVKIGSIAEVTLDAFGKNELFKAQVIKIEPKEVLIEGIATYKTILRFLDSNSKIKSGMTANINILVDKKENVLVVPIKAVFEKEDKKFVKVLEKNDKNIIIKEVEVKTGLKNNEGEVEIIEGLNENQEIVI
ncbi:MAG: efflux RND transporter periplasmic adaptor subunit [Candidatus Pacearchaeota archaeon]